MSKPNYKVVICGSRTFSDFDLLEEKTLSALKERNISFEEYNVVVISGEAKGADELGERFAEKYNLEVERYPAKWDDLTAEPCKVKYNKWGKPYNCLAGLNRNTEMLEEGNLVIMFHDGVSKGTLDDLDKCKKMNKDYEYYLF